MKRHILVIGDLFIDHDIFVTQLGMLRDTEPEELRFNVVRRQDTAGGAANSARILSVMNDGITYLWGIVGNSHWGTFREILEKSHAIDGASHPVELRGVRDETDAPMNTVTRILVVNEDAPKVVTQRFCRYYDMDHIHVPENKYEALLYHLDRIQDEKSQLHAIVINDFNRRTLTKPLIEAIAIRAARNKIPLFVDPHHDRAQYASIRATAILPNLSEWCNLVSDKHGADYWRKNLGEAAALQEMAIQSFRHLGNFDYHIVKCDRDGAVLFFPHAEKRNLYALYRVGPVPTRESTPPSQLGCGDVMTASFALEFPQENPTTDKVLHAFQRANAVVACYREMPWHQMPQRADIEQKQKAFDEPIHPDAEITKGILFLPEMHNIDMPSYETAVTGLFSQDSNFKNIVNEFFQDTIDRWTDNPLKSVILGAPPGTGKTTIISRSRNGI